MAGEGFQVPGFDGYYDQEGRPIKSRVAKQVNKEESGGLLGEIKLSNTFTDMKEQVGLGPDEQFARQAFSAGEDLFRREQYSDAAKKFKQAIARWPDSKLEQDAMFQLAESYFFAEKYPEANDAYEALVQKYSNTPHLDKLVRRQFELAQFWEKYHRYEPHWAITPNLFDRRRPLFDTAGRALKIYENIRLNDPTGPLADDAVMATANTYFLRGRYRDADYHYQLLREEYPRSDHQYEAHILGLQCKLRKYQGPDYDGAPLEEAKKLSRQLHTQFAAELNEERRTQLAEIDGRISKQLATRVHAQAKYHEAKEEFRSAKIYYAELVKNHPNTELAATARDRLKALAEEPDVPGVPLESLVNLFPQNAERAAIAQVPLLPESNPVQMASRHEDVSGGVENANATKRR